MNEIQKQCKKAIVISTAIPLIVIHGSTTTLDIKNYLRQTFSKSTYLHEWTQQFVSETMDELHSVFGLTWEDSPDGNHRIYKSAESSNSEYEYVEDFLVNTKGRFFTIDYGNSCSKVVRYVSNSFDDGSFDVYDMNNNASILSFDCHRDQIELKCGNTVVTIGDT